MNGAFKLVLKLPRKVDISADPVDKQRANDEAGPSKKKRKHQSEKSGRASSADGHRSGAPTGGAVPERPHQPQQANGGAGSEYKPRLSIKLPSFKSVGLGAGHVGPPQPPRPWQGLPNASGQSSQQKALPVLRIPGSLLQSAKKRKVDAKRSTQHGDVHQIQGTKKTTVASGFKAPGKELRPGSAQKRPASSLSGPGPSGSVGVEAGVHELKSSLDQPGAASQPDSSVSGPAKRADVQRVLDRLQKKDTYNIFKNPVTEEMAPGYYSVIKKGMDFTTIWNKFNKDGYKTWDEVQADVTLMFTNAMTYNAPDTVYHKQAKNLLELSNKLVELASKGIMDFRGRVAHLSRLQNAQIAAEQAEEREKARLAARQHKAAIRAAKLAEQRALAGMPVDEEDFEVDGDGNRPRIGPLRRPANADENVRQTFPQRTHHGVGHWHALAFGSSAEGVVYSNGRPVLRPLNAGPVQLIAYADSLTSFSAKFGGKLKNLVLNQAKQTDPKSHMLPFGPSYGAQARPPMAAATANLQQLRPMGAAALSNLPPAAPAIQQRAKPVQAHAQPPQQQPPPAAVPLPVPGAASHPTAAGPGSMQQVRATPSGWPLLTPRPPGPPGPSAAPANHQVGAGGMPGQLNVNALAQRLVLGLGAGSGAAAPSVAAPSSGPHQPGTSAPGRVTDLAGGCGPPSTSSGVPTPLQSSPAQGLWNSLPQQMQQRLAATARPGAVPAASTSTRADPSQAANQPPVDLLTAASRFPMLAGQIGAAPLTQQLAQMQQANLMAVISAYQASAARTLGSGTAIPAAPQARTTSAAAGAAAGSAGSTYVQQNTSRPQQPQGPAAPLHQALQQHKPAVPAQQGQPGMGFQHAQPQTSPRQAQQDRTVQAYQHALQQSRFNPPQHGNAGMAYLSAQHAQPQQPSASLAAQPFGYSSMGLAGSMPPSSVGAVPPATNPLAVPLGTLAPVRMPHASASEAPSSQNMFQHVGGGTFGGVDQRDGRGPGAVPVHPPGQPGLPAVWAAGQTASQPPDAQMWMSAAVGEGQIGGGGDLAEADLDYDLPDDLF